MLASERICSRSWNECLCIVLRLQKQTQWSTWAPPAAVPWTPGPAGSPFQLPPVHCGSHPPANLMSTSPAGLGPPAGELFGDRALWRQQSRRAGLGRGSGMSQSWAPAAGRARSVHRLAHPPGQAPGNAERSPVGTRGGSRKRVGSRSIVPAEPLGLGNESGSLGRRPLPWEAPSSGRPSGPGGLRRGLGRPETCLAVGRCDLSRG